jgi:hypothetical protein
MALKVTTATKDHPIYKSGVEMMLINGENAKKIIAAKKKAQAEKNKALVNIYPKNQFLLHDEDNKIWFSLENIVDKKYFEIPFAIITAWNPNNESRAKEANIFMNKKLENHIKALKFYYEPTVGKYGEHGEDSFIIYRINRTDAIKLGQVYEQYSIFYNSSTALEYIECATEDIILQRSI